MLIKISTLTHLEGFESMGVLGMMPCDKEDFKISIYQSEKENLDDAIKDISLNYDKGKVLHQFKLTAEDNQYLKFLGEEISYETLTEDQAKDLVKRYS